MSAKHPEYITTRFIPDAATGWIADNGEIWPTALYNHLGMFLDEYCPLPTVWERVGDHVFEHFELQQKIHRESGMRWHEYNPDPFSPDYDLADELRDLVYESGWGRIGTYADRLGRTVNPAVIELQCLEAHRENLLRHLKPFARQIGREIVICVIEPLSVVNAAPTTTP